MGWKYNNNYNHNNSNNNQNWRANNFNNHQYNSVAPRFQPLPSGLDQWACTVCHLVHHNMEKHSCRRAGCKGINPYIQQPAPQVSMGPTVHMDSAWAGAPNTKVMSHTCSPTSLLSSSSAHSSSSHVPLPVQNQLGKMGVWPPQEQEDTIMGEEGKPAQTPTPPCADLHLKKVKELQSLREMWEAAVGEFGEDSLQAKALKEGMEKYGPQTTS
eukprot:9943696-Karenia_brevis.AAC.1